MTTLEFISAQDARDLVNRIASERDPGKRKRPSKYKNKITYVGTKRFHSAKEARRYQDLLILERAGEITELECQVKLPLITRNVAREDVVIGKYLADFRYFDNRKGEFIYEDTKGCVTQVYALKKRIIEACHGIKILET